MGAGVVPKPKHYGYGTTPRDIALAALYRCPPDSGGQFAQFETSRVLQVFKPAPILASDYSAIVNLDRCGLTAPTARLNVYNAAAIRIDPRKEPNMPQEQSRRNILKGGLALAGLGAFGLPEWVLPVLAQGETLVPFTDIPANANFTPAADRRTLDIRKIDGPFTPKDQFFTTQHYGHPDVDPATFRLKISGLVDKPKSLSLDDLRKIGNTELIAGFECSGNRRPLQGLSGNGRWTGVSLKSVLDSTSVKASAREFVFYGADHGSEDVEFRTQKFTLEYNFGRSLAREKALSGEPFSGVGTKRRAVDETSGSSTSAHRSGLVWCGQCEVAFTDSCAGRTVSRQVSITLVSHHSRRNGRWRNEVERDCCNSHAVEILYRAGNSRRQSTQGDWRGVERRYAAEVRRS
jgi:DMSO/TMAO reductase YedYZ molybdopterin-dependent catalytic subunit